MATTSEAIRGEYVYETMAWETSTEAIIGLTVIAMAIISIARDLPMSMRPHAKEIISTSLAAELFIGFGAITLGILAVIGMAPMVLTIIAFLGIGCSSALAGSALNGDSGNWLMNNS